MSEHTPLLEWCVVLLLVAGSVLFTVWRLLPTPWRVRVQLRLGWRVQSAACGCEVCPRPAPPESGSSAP